MLIFSSKIFRIILWGIILGYWQQQINPTREMEEAHVKENLSDNNMPDNFFESFQQWSQHEARASDGTSILAYRDAIYKNQHIFKNKIVLNVCAGTGILAMFAAQAGAYKVIGIEPTDVAKFANKIVKANKFENTVTIIQGNIEDVTLPFNIQEVDIIIANWMGTNLFFQSNLADVLIARDRWLKPGGFILPDRCTLYIIGIEDRKFREAKIDWWDDVYGFNMRAIGKAAITEPNIDWIEHRQVVTTKCMLREVNLYDMQMDEFNFSVGFYMQIRRDDYIQAFATYFTVEFSRGLRYVGFTTAPTSSVTHWKQTIFYTQTQLAVRKNDAIAGTFRLKFNTQDYSKSDIEVELDFIFHGAESDGLETTRYLMH